MRTSATTTFRSRDADDSSAVRAGEELPEFPVVVLAALQALPATPPRINAPDSRVARDHSRDLRDWQRQARDGQSMPIFQCLSQFAHFRDFRGASSGSDR
jgi:hypothetical protein